MSKTNTCGTCALRSPDETRCGLFNILIDQQKDFCSKNTKNPSFCEICGRYLSDKSQTTLIPIGEKYHEICNLCSESLWTCSTCYFGNICKFETDNSPIPKSISQRIQKGNMIIETTVKNPDRIKITCETGCDCWYDNYCHKEDFNCKNHMINL